MENKTAAVSKKAIDAFIKLNPVIMEKVMERTMLQNNIISLYGDEAGKKFSAGISWTAKMLETAMTIDEPKLLEEQLQWAQIRLPVDNIKPEHVLSMLHNYQDAISEFLPAVEAKEINNFVTMMLKKQESLMENKNE